MKIGNFTIDSQKIYDALINSGVSDEKVLKKLDKNNDNKISEDELVEFCEISEDEDEMAQTSASNSSAVDEQLDMLQTYDKQLLSLETKQRQINSSLGSAADAKEYQSLMDELNATIQQIGQVRQNIYNLLVQSENQEMATNGVGAVNGDGYSGLTTGSGISGGSAFGNTVASIAQSYAGKLKESDGSYLQVTGGRQEAWCADFVTYVVKQACAKSGKSLNGFGSPSVSSLQAWGQANKCYIDVSGSGNRAQTIVQNIKPGDVMIQKNNGASHTGIVTKVYPDGSFDTVEGNTSDQCLPRHYSASDAKLSGFVKIT